MRYYVSESIGLKTSSNNRHPAVYSFVFLLQAVIGCSSSSEVASNQNRKNPALQEGSNEKISIYATQTPVPTPTPIPTATPTPDDSWKQGNKIGREDARIFAGPFTDTQVRQMAYGNAKNHKAKDEDSFARGYFVGFSEEWKKKLSR